jgi:hypothetical protein
MKEIQVKNPAHWGSGKARVHQQRQSSEVRSRVEGVDPQVAGASIHQPSTIVNAKAGNLHGDYGLSYLLIVAFDGGCGKLVDNSFRRPGHTTFIYVWRFGIALIILKERSVIGGDLQQGEDGPVEFGRRSCLFPNA